MNELHDYTLKQVSDYLIEELAADRGLTKAQARKLFINAISYNVVVESIYEQVDFLIEERFK